MGSMLIKNKELNNMKSETKKMLNKISKQVATLEAELRCIEEEKAAAKHKWNLRLSSIYEKKIELYEAEQNLLKAAGVK